MFLSYLIEILQIRQVEVEWLKEVFILPEGVFEEEVGRVGVREGGGREGRI